MSSWRDEFAVASRERTLSRARRTTGKKRVGGQSLNCELIKNRIL